MEDFTTVDTALGTGYYQLHFEALPFIVVAVITLAVLIWSWQKRNDKP